MPSGPWRHCVACWGDGLTQHQDDFEEFLRRALHAAADPVEPSGDGLEQIRARLTAPHPLPVAWLLAACSGVSRRAVGGLDYLSARLRGVGGASGGRWRARPGTPGWRRVVRGRLAAALVMAAFVVAAAFFAGGPVLREASSLTGALIGSLDGGGNRGAGGPGVTGGPGVNGQGNPLPAGDGSSSVPASAGAVTGTAPGTGNPGQPGSGECATQSPVLGTPAGSPPASVNPAVSATPAPSQSLAASTSPTPDPSSSPHPSASPDPSASPGGNTSPSEGTSPGATATPCPAPAAASTASPSADTTSSSASAVRGRRS